MKLCNVSTYLLWCKSAYAPIKEISVASTDFQNPWRWPCHLKACFSLRGGKQAQWTRSWFGRPLGLDPQVWTNSSLQTQCSLDASPPKVAAPSSAKLHLWATPGNPGIWKFGNLWTWKSRNLGSKENKHAKHEHKKRTGIWTFGASGTSSWWVKLWKLSRVLRTFHFFEKSYKTWTFQNCYWNLDFLRLPGRALAGQINCAVLCFLFFIFFEKC